MSLGTILTALLITSSGWTVHFSPNGGCTTAITTAIRAVHQDSVLVLAYSFTSPPIADALIDAKKAGNVVRVIIDYKSSLDTRCEGLRCKAAGIEVYTDSVHAIAHNKIILAGRRVIGGSFNYSKNAEAHNAENCPISPPNWDLQPAYDAEWHKHLAHSSRL